tara:strand:- start:45 stop:236 length:192 start_codon:yes stop_codon:yes gene_type:complete
MNILKVGQGNASDMRRQFENRLKAKADRSQHVYMNKISLLDPGNLKAFAGGCKILFDWYKSRF